MGYSDNAQRWLHTDLIGQQIRTNPNAQNLLNAATRLHEGLISSPSVDDFLHNHGEDDAVIYMGKLGIARCILEAENSSLLRGGRGVKAWIVGGDYDDRPERLLDNLQPATVMRALRPTWLGELFAQLTPGVSKGKVGTLFDRVRFICFNYDRCIETGLFYALRSHYGISAEQAGEVIAGLNIVHPYGTIGGLTFVPKAKDPVVFGQSTNHADLARMAANIRTYNEQIDGCCDQTQISNYITEAENVVFLGFAYHKQNMALLTCTGELRRPAAMGTAMKEADSRQDVFRRRIAETGMSPVYALADRTCLEFVHDQGPNLLD
jgi:hypothetical protein